MESSKKRFLKNMIGFSLTAWTAFAISLIATPLSTRLFAPGELGKINLFNTYAALAASFCYLGLDQAFVRFFREPPGRASRASMFTFCAATSVGFSLLVTGAAFAFWREISRGVTGEADIAVFACLGLFSLCMVLFRYLSLCYRMEQNAKLYTIQGVAHALLTKVAYLAVGFRGGGGRAAILALTGLMGLFTLAFILAQRKRFDAHFRSRSDRPFLQNMTAYAAPLIPLAVITWLNNSVSPLVLRQLLGFASVGVFTSALGLASTVNVIQTGFTTYWAPYVYEHYQSGNSRRFFTVHRLMACALTLFILGLTLLQGPVFLLLGPAYRSSAVYFPFLFLSPVCYCLSETTGLGIGIAKKTHWNTLAFLLSVGMNLALCFLLIPFLGETGAAIAAAAAAIVSLLLRTWAGERYYKAIPDYRYVAYTVGLGLLAAAANYLLAGRDSLKYGFLAILLIVGCRLFWKELGTLLGTARAAALGPLSAWAGRAVRRESGKNGGKGAGAGSAISPIARPRALIIADGEALWTRRYIEDLLLPAGYETVLFPIYGGPHQGISPAASTHEAYYRENRVRVYEDRHTLPLARRVPRLRMWLRVWLNARQLRRLGPFSVVHNHYLSQRDLALGWRIVKGEKKKGPEGPKWVASFWGSDLLRSSKRALARMKPYLRKCDWVTVHAAPQREMLKRLFGESVADRTALVYFGQPGLASIDRVRARMDRAACKAHFGIGPDRFVVCVGYSASPAQQQDKALQALIGRWRGDMEALRPSRFSRITVVLQMTYGKTDEAYMERVRDLAAALPCKCLILTSFLDGEESAMLRLCADVFLQTVRTDSFSGSLQEYLYAGARVLAGAWLDYPQLREMGIGVHYCADFKEMAGALEEMAGTEKTREAEAPAPLPREEWQRRSILKDRYSWDGVREGWLRLYRDE
ncbi:MAG: polysaccharide biosynthesis C-terminal domain-containing protein [Clostridia bacterium]|nr:polysaccharide biosynthesis C-terminal domain-containing protein [Clostridia bacterium]